MKLKKTAAALMMTMKKRTSLLLIIPLGAGLLYLGSLATDPPGAIGRPASSVVQPAIEDDADRQVDVVATIATIDYAPARSDFLETVVAQGTVGDRKAAIRALRHLATTEAINILSIALGDSDPRVSKAAFEALE